MEVIQNEVKEKVPYILVVDDNRINLQVISQTLKSLGTDVKKAENGQKALEIIEQEAPALILLDIMMPGMDGYEVCRRVKENPDHKDIPVIFLTANVDSENILFAFEAGIVDYIVKPFNPSELLARVRTHMDLMLSKEKLKDLNKKLIKYNAEKNEFLGMVSHDLKNPIFNIQMLAKVLVEEDNMSEEDRKEFLGDILTTSNKMLDLIKNLLDVNRTEEGSLRLKLEPLDLIQSVRHSVKDYEERAANKRIKLYFNSELSRAMVYADEMALTQVMDNLISNAIKYSDYDENILINVSDEENMIRVEIKDNGPGFEEDEKIKVFDRFVKLSNKPTAGESSTGLGLSITKRYIGEMNGRIWLESKKSEGSSFFFELPKS